MWKKPAGIVGGQELSLDDIENVKLRAPTVRDQGGIRTRGRGDPFPCRNSRWAFPVESSLYTFRVTVPPCHLGFSELSGGGCGIVCEHTITSKRETRGLAITHDRAHPQTTRARLETAHTPLGSCSCWPCPASWLRELLRWPRLRVHLTQSLFVSACFLIIQAYCFRWYRF